MEELFDSIIAASSALQEGERIGHSREGRPITAYRFGQGAFRISLIAGCHSDEPVGPRLLRHLVAYFSHLPQGSEILENYQWWIVPHANPDGEEVNRSWYTDRDEQIDLIPYLEHVKRELPGDDIEFGFPRDPSDRDARPENKSIAAWWMKEAGSFHLHVSLHGMAFAGGPFFLIEPAWSSRCEELKAKCRRAVSALGYRLHDADRQGKKGFFRLEKGFATRPNSKAMSQYFLDQRDEVTAGRFRPSSMETIRALGGDPLTLVTEMPLFLLPKVGEVLGPPDPEAERWKSRIEKWKVRLRSEPGEADPVREEASVQGLAAMPIRDQMKLQWVFLVAGLQQVQGRLL
jgi:hypothetical protein